MSLLGIGHLRALRAKTLGINLEERGQNTNIRHPNEICDLISQNNILADPDSRNSNNRDGF